jgi:hypothetical protein
MKIEDELVKRYRLSDARGLRPLPPYRRHDRPMNSSVMTRLLSLNAGFVDTVSFLGLQGLFTAHVTGNFVTLAAGLVYGPNGAIGKILASNDGEL